MTTSTPEERLAALGLTLPAVPTPMANYVPYRLAGNLLLPFRAGAEARGRQFHGRASRQGRLGRARLRSGAPHGLQLLAVAKAALGELSRVEAVVKLLGMVNAEPDFRRPSQGHQRLLRPHGRGARRSRAPCAFSRWHGFAAKPHHGRDRGHSADQSLGGAPFDIGDRESVHDLRDMRGFCRWRPRREGMRALNASSSAPTSWRAALRRASA